MKFQTTIDKRELDNQIKNLVKGNLLSYYQEFKFFCSVYKKREEHLSRAIIEYLPKSLETDDKTYRILDVGSSDGTLLRKLICQLSTKMKTNIEAVTLEPDGESYLHLMDKFEKIVGSEMQYTVENFEMRLEDYLCDERYLMGKFDLVLCSHVFYHFELDKWPILLSQLKEMLSDNGSIIVILDSYDSPIYYLNENIELYLETNCRTDFGQDISAEMFLSKLNKRQYFCTTKFLDSHIVLPYGGYESFSVLLRLLSFLYRHSIKIEGKLVELLTHFARTFAINDCINIPWREMLFVIK